MRMRGLMAAAVALVGALPAYAACDLDAPDMDRAGMGCAQAWLETRIHLNQLQWVGTAESYKQAPGPEMLSLIAMGNAKDKQALDFSQPSLKAQLDAGARALSFDVAYDPSGGLFKNPAGASMAGELLDPAYVAAMSQPGFKVIHVLDVDWRSSCLTLDACLTEVADWHRAHPHHLPIVIALKTNDRRTPMPGAARPAPFEAAAFAALDQDLRAHFRADEIIFPDQVKGGHASLREAALSGSWPSIAGARGKVIFLLDDNAEKIARYAPGQDLSGKAMFVAADESSPLAAFVAVDDPLKDSKRIADDVTKGFIVITRADGQTVEARADDTRRRDAAFATGAQIIQTDFLLPDPRLGPYRVAIADARHAVCDPRTGGDACAAWHQVPVGRTADAR